MASCEEVTALLACSPADVSALHQCTRRIQEMAARMKEQHEARGLLTSAVLSAAKEVKVVAASIWNWPRQHRKESRGAEDLHAARPSHAHTHKRSRPASHDERYKLLAFDTHERASACCLFCC